MKQGWEKTGSERGRMIERETEREGGEQKEGTRKKEKREG